MQGCWLYNMDCAEGLKTKVKAESIDLIIADPPYFKVIGEKWDHQWKILDDYILWSNKWIKEAVRVLRKGGTFYLFGYFRMLCHLVPILEREGLEIRQQIILNKGMQAVAGRATKKYKMFPNVTESILFCVKDSKPFIKQFLRKRQADLGYTSKYINEALGVKSNGGGMWSIYTGKNICEQLPTKELWDRLSEVLKFDLPYNKIAQTYHAQLGLTDVWDDINFYNEKDRIHPTQKPKTLIERLIFASSSDGNLVLDPFMGSGIVAVVCKEQNRSYVGFEIDQQYFEKVQTKLGGGNH